MAVGVLARNTLLATAWQSLRLVLQFTYLVLVARVLGVEGYGVFSATVALATSLSPIVGWGFGMILIQQVSRSPQSFPEFWAKALRAIALSGPIMVSAIFVVAPLLLPLDQHWRVVLLISAAELIAMPVISASSQAFQAHEQLGRMVFNHVQLNLIRLGSIALLAIFEQNQLLAFAWAYFGATTCAAFLSFYQIGKILGHPDITRGKLIGHLRTGLSFSLGVVANTAHGEFDKTLLLRLDSAATAGNYSVATRIAAAATTPLTSYILAAVPRLFREGQLGINPTAKLGKKLLPPILLYGLITAAGIYIARPLLPWIFGDQYSEATHLIAWLAPLPLLIGLSQLALNILSASGLQHLRALFEGTSFFINILLNIIFIPWLGAPGSAIAIIISQSTLALLAGIKIVRLLTTDPKKSND